MKIKTLKSYILLLSFLLLGCEAFFAQTYPFEKWDSLTLEKANTAKDINYLSKEEKKVIFYTNLSRMNGPLFAKTWLQAYLDSTETEPTKWTRSLRKDLKKTKQMSPLKPKRNLYDIAKKHAEDMGKAGKTGHRSSKGKGFSQRIKSLIKKYEEVFENCDYGYKDGLSIVIDLLIDEGIANVGHRKAILNPDLKYIGTSIQPHKKYGYNCVMDFGGKIY